MFNFKPVEKSQLRKKFKPKLKRMMKKTCCRTPDTEWATFIVWSKLGWRPELFWRIYNGESGVDTIKIWGKNLVLQKGSVANKHQLCFVYFVYLKKISGSNCSPSQLEHKNYSISKQLQAHSSLFLHRRFYNWTHKLPPKTPSVQAPK